MLAVSLNDRQWRIVLSAVQGLHAQCLALVGPMADGGQPRSMAAVKVIGDCRWIEAAILEIVGDQQP